MKLVTTVVVLALICTALVAQPMLLAREEFAQIQERRLSFDREIDGFFDSKYRSGSRTVVRYRFSPVEAEDGRNPIYWSVYVDRQTFDGAVRDKAVHVLYSSKNVYVSDIKTNTYYQMVEQSYWLMIGVFIVFLCVLIFAIVCLIGMRTGRIKF